MKKIKPLPGNEITLQALSGKFCRPWTNQYSWKIDAASREIYYRINCCCCCCCCLGGREMILAGDLLLSTTAGVNEYRPRFMRRRCADLEAIYRDNQTDDSSSNVEYTGWAKKVNPKCSTHNFVKYWPI